MFDWNDLRHFLAVARAGTTLGAARALGVSQPTVVRRVAALEAACGVALFDRHSSGYALTEDGRSVLPLAERVEAEVGALSNTLAACARKATNAIRLTAAENLVNDFVLPALANFRAKFPNAKVQLIATDAKLDLMRGEADVALRAGIARPEDGDLVGRRLPDPAWAVFGSRSYIAEAGRPAGAEELDGHALIGGEGEIVHLPAMRWLAEAAPQASVVWRANTLTSLHAAVRAGLGLSVLPCMIAGRDPELVQCFPPPPELDSEMWIVTRPELRDDPCVRALMSLIAERLTELAAVTRGEAV
jgi:DNA-binding transcriptional LysR family regulator